MKYYVVINGESSLDIEGLAIESLPAISKPLMRSKREEIDGRNGDIITQLGFSAYDKTLKIGLWGNYDIDEVITFFNQDGIITFSNEPDMYYNFTILNRIDFINQLEAFRKATITIHCQPFKYKEEETEELEVITKEVSGTDISVDDAVDGAMDITLKGNTYQKTAIIPNPSYPQDIHNVSGNNTISVVGKNLFDKNNITTGKSYSNTGDIISLSDTFIQESYINVIPNEYYSFSLVNTIQSGNYRIQIVEYDKNKTFIKRNQIGSGRRITIQLSTNTTFVRLGSMTASIDELQFEKGQERTTYEAYNGTTYPINLGSIELCKIGTYQDYIYKEDDKWYLHKEIGKVVLNGSETYGGGGYATNNDNYVYIYTNEIDSYVKSSYNGLSYCNRFIDYEETLTINSTNINSNVFSVGASNQKIRLMINKSYLSDLSSVSARINSFKTLLSNNNTIVNYVLETPTNTEITDTTLIEQLEAIKNANSYYGTTNINQVNNDMPFILDISYLSGTNNITITNHGNYYSKPKLTLTGTGNIGIYLNDSQIFQVSLGTDETIIIDTDKMEAYYESTLKNRQVIGDYNSFKLLSGENTIKISGTFSKLQVDNYSRWI